MFFNVSNKPLKVISIHQLLPEFVDIIIRLDSLQ